MLSGAVHGQDAMAGNMSNERRWYGGHPDRLRTRKMLAAQVQYIGCWLRQVQCIGRWVTHAYQ